MHAFRDGMMGPCIRGGATVRCCVLIKQLYDFFYLVCAKVNTLLCCSRALSWDFWESNRMIFFPWGTLQDCLKSQDQQHKKLWPKDKRPASHRNSPPRPHDSSIKQDMTKTTRGEPATEIPRPASMIAALPSRIWLKTTRGQPATIIPRPARMIALSSKMYIEIIKK